MSQLLPTRVAICVLQASIVLSETSSETLESALRVLPNAAILEFFNPRLATSSKNCISLGLEAA
jgi:hypothetical protein